MTLEMSFLDVKYMVEELQVLVGARLQRIFQPDGLYLQFHKSGVGKFELRIEETVLWLTEKKPLMPTKVPGFCAKLRKHLKGKKCAALEQLGSERVVKFTFETQQETYFLFVELFGKGNIILADDKKTILAAFEERSWKDRDVRRKKIYELPPQKQNLFEIEQLPEEEKEIAALGFGRRLAKEILARGGGVDAWHAILKEPKRPHRYSDGHISPIELKQYGEEGERAESFSKLIDDVLAVSSGEEKQQAQLSKVEKKRQKLSKVIETQEQTRKSLLEKAELAQRKGELVYEHFQDLQAILEEVKAKKSAKDVQAGAIKAKNFSAKTGDVTVEIEW